MAFTGGVVFVGWPFASASFNEVREADPNFVISFKIRSLFSLTFSQRCIAFAEWFWMANWSREVRDLRTS